MERVWQVEGEMPGEWWIGESSMAVPAPSWLDPHFLFEGRRHLSWRLRDGCGPGLDYLEYRIVAVPGDLRAHVARIALLVRCARRERLVGALADLWIVLGTAGEALRLRLLQALAPLLDEDAAAGLLWGCRGQCLRPWDPRLAGLPGCLLGLGVQGDTDLSQLSEKVT